MPWDLNDMHCLLELPAHGRRGVKDSPMFIRAIAFLLFLAPLVLAQQPTPIEPDPKLTPGDAFDVTVSVYPDTAERCVTFRRK